MNKCICKTIEKNYDIDITLNKELNDKKENIKQIKINNLKSPLLKIIFSFLKENKKLKIIKVYKIN